MKRLAILLGLFILFSAGADAQNQVARVKGIYIYNFTKHVQWPYPRMDNDLREEFRIGVLGSPQLPIAKEFEQMTGRKVIDSRDEASMLSFSSPEDIEPCHILFIPEGKANMLDHVVEEVDDQHTLIICEEDNALENGAAINLVRRNSRIKFQVDKDNLEKYGLKITDYLYQMRANK